MLIFSSLSLFFFVSEPGETGADLSPCVDAAAATEPGDTSVYLCPRVRLLGSESGETSVSGCVNPRAHF